MPPHHGTVQYNSRVIGNEAAYACNPGYQLTFGDQIRECLVTRMWSGMAPCCIGKYEYIYLCYADCLARAKDRNIEIIPTIFLS